MKKTLMILINVFVVLVVLALVVIAFVVVKGAALDKESKQFVDAAVPAIAAEWNIAEIQNRASPEFKASVKAANLEKLVRMVRELGKFKAYNGAKGYAYPYVSSEHGKLLVATYVATADFENGPAEIKISLVKHGDRWQLFGLHVTSKVFSE